MVRTTKDVVFVATEDALIDGVLVAAGERVLVKANVFPELRGKSGMRRRFRRRTRSFHVPHFHDP